MQANLDEGWFTGYNLCGPKPAGHDLPSLVTQGLFPQATGELWRILPLDPAIDFHSYPDVHEITSGVFVALEFVWPEYAINVRAPDGLVRYSYDVNKLAKGFYYADNYFPEFPGSFYFEVGKCRKLAAVHPGDQKFGAVVKERGYAVSQAA